MVIFASTIQLINAEHLFFIYTPDLGSVVSFGKGSRAALKGALREHRGSRKEQEGAKGEKPASMMGEHERLRKDWGARRSTEAGASSGSLHKKCPGTGIVIGGR